MYISLISRPVPGIPGRPAFGSNGTLQSEPLRRPLKKGRLIQAQPGRPGHDADLLRG
jgi:hypothetical protein